MYFACKCDDLQTRQEFARLRLRAIILLISIASRYNSLWHEFESECDLNELAMELMEIVESITSSNENENEKGSEIPMDIKILAIVGLKQHISTFQLTRSRDIWEENEFIGTTMRRLINDLRSETELSQSYITFACHFFSFINRCLAYTKAQSICMLFVFLFSLYYIRNLFFAFPSCKVV